MKAVTIWKYPLPLSVGELTIKMPRDSKVLTVQVQHDRPCLWVMVDPESPLEERIFRVFGTGQEISTDSRLHYVGTWQRNAFVWHLFGVEV